jgi:cyclase
VIASGGAGTLDDLEEALVEADASAALAASIFHDGTYSVEETKRFLADQGVDVRQDT